MKNSNLKENYKANMKHLVAKKFKCDQSVNRYRAIQDESLNASIFNEIVSECYPYNCFHKFDVSLTILFEFSLYLAIRQPLVMTALTILVYILDLCKFNPQKYLDTLQKRFQSQMNSIINFFDNIKLYRMQWGSLVSLVDVELI